MRITWFVSVTSLTVLAACNPTSTVDNSTATPVRFVNASHASPNVDIYADSKLVVSALGVGTASSCVTVPLAASLIVRPAGDANTIITQTTPVLAQQTRYTVVIGGDAAGSTRELVFPDVFLTPIGGRGRVQVIHAASNAGGQDVFVTAPGATLGAASFTNLQYGGTSAYLDVPTGSTEVRVTPAGSTTVVNASSSSFTLSGNQSQTFVLMSTTGGGFTMVNVQRCP